MTARPFTPPAYPYDRLGPIKELAAARHGAAIDLSVGTPVDPPSPRVLAVLAASTDAARRYPQSVGSAGLREAFCAWFENRLGVRVDPGRVAATIGAKEFVAGTPHLLRLRRPDRDTVLYQAVSYPSYAMGAMLAGCRAVPVPETADHRLDLDAITPEDAARALCLWVNSPANPTGALENLERVAEWGRRQGVPVLSDECYVEFTWSGPRFSPADRPGDTILRYGTEGVLAVHSLSKRSNLAGVRVGCYAGDPELVGFLSSVRQHLGLMVPGPAQAAGIAALEDQSAVDEQVERYRRRLTQVRDALGAVGVDAPLPDGGFYLWCRADAGDGWTLAERLAERLGVVVSPGEFYGDASAAWARVAVVADDAQCAELARRAGAPA